MEEGKRGVRVGAGGRRLGWVEVQSYRVGKERTGRRVTVFWVGSAFVATVLNAPLPLTPPSG